MPARPRGLVVDRVLTTALVILVGVSPSRAQSSDDFGTIELGVGGSWQATQPYDDEWSPTPGLSLRAATPFHGGLAFLTARGGLHSGTTDELPDFVAIQGFAGWGPVVMAPGRVRLLPSAHVGAMAFLFDDDGAFTGALQNESELTLGISGRVDVPVVSGLRAWAGVDVVRLFTTPRELLVFAEGGLSVALHAPRWFRRALR